jgi:AcrR family transcriptional regulator
MSLYHHFPSKAALMDALVDRVVAELPTPPPPAPWRQRITRMAWDFRAMALRHPAFFKFLALHRMNTPGGLAWLNGALQAFRDTGLEDREASRLFRAFGAFIIGAALDETAGYSKGPSAVKPPDDATIARDYPAVLAAAAHFGRDSAEAIFEFGLNAMLEAVAAHLPSRASEDV